MSPPIAWLLDTNVVSEMMRPHPEPRVSVFLDSIAPEGMSLSPITVWEILDGIGRLDSGKRRANLAIRFRNVLDECFDQRILSWTVDDARACARIMEEKRRRGEPLDDHIPDAFLAAAAATRGLTVVTRNTRDFRNTGVTVVDPWAEPVPLRGAPSSEGRRGRRRPQ